MLGCSLAGLGRAAGVPRSQCFPVEKLSAADRQTAEGLLLQAMDGDALYTIITGLKPITTAYAQRPGNSARSGIATHFSVKTGEVEQLRQLQMLDSPLSCGDGIRSGAAVMSGGTDNDSRVVWPFIANRAALEQAIAAHESPYGKVQ